MTEREKMLAGELYSARDEELKAAHARAISLCEKLNFGNLADEEREEVTKQLLGKCGKNTVLGRGFWCDYGCKGEDRQQLPYRAAGRDIYGLPSA